MNKKTKDADYFGQIEELSEPEDIDEESYFKGIAQVFWEDIDKWHQSFRQIIEKQNESIAQHEQKRRLSPITKESIIVSTNQEITESAEKNKTSKDEKSNHLDTLVSLIKERKLSHVEHRDILEHLHVRGLSQRNFFFKLLNTYCSWNINIENEDRDDLYILINFVSKIDSDILLYIRNNIDIEKFLWLMTITDSESCIKLIKNIVFWNKWYLTPDTNSEKWFHMRDTSILYVIEHGNLENLSYIIENIDWIELAKLFNNNDPEVLVYIIENILPRIFTTLYEKDSEKFLAMLIKYTNGRLEELVDIVNNKERLPRR